MAPKTYRLPNGLTQVLDLDGMKEGHRLALQQQIDRGLIIELPDDDPEGEF